MITETQPAQGFQRLAEANKKQSEGIFEQIPLPACMVDLDHHEIIFTNSAFNNFLAIHGLTANEIPIPYSKLSTGHLLLSEEFTMISSANKKVSFLLSGGNPIETSHGQQAHVVYLNDVTYMRRIEAELAANSEAQLLQTQSNEYSGLLNNEQQELIAKLKQAQANAENANKNKSMFLANVSHEIRTPLTAILGFADLLKDGPVSEGEKAQFVETINRNGNALIKIIDDVLDLSKVEANCLELEKIELSPRRLLQDVVQQFQARANSKNITVALDIQNELPYTILSDSVRIQQVVSNLLSNAIKFTDKGGVVVRVNSSMLTPLMTEIQIRVIDTGIGLTEEQTEKLFLPFSQAETSTTRKFGGTGLGLALSKHLAEALGGSLRIERSEKDIGCTFTFTLTAEISEQVLEIENVDSKQIVKQMDFVPLAGFNILLAEDAVDNQYFLEKFLAKHGAKVTIAMNGLEAISRAKKSDFDIILMDIEMPEMDGYEATRVLRKDGFKLPILALTAHAMAEERNKTREAGCNGHLTKPIDTNQLLAELENHLKSKKKKR